MASAAFMKKTATGPRRMFMCTECHKQFKSREELYLHAELCLIEAFETEAKNVLSENNKCIIDPDEPADDGQEDNVDDEADDPRCAAQIECTQLVEGEGGLKLMVSVERPDYDEENDNDDDTINFLQDDLNDENLIGIDEDISIPPEMTGAGSGGVEAGRGKIRGALANADDDPLRPKMECPTCGIHLYRHNFSTHYRIHTGEMPFSCNYCEKRFRTTSALKVHMRAHTGEKPYVCPRCNYACITKRNLDRHIINNHVREGVRRGPRYRRSRYRVTDPDHDQYLTGMGMEHNVEFEDDDEQEETEEGK